MADANSEYILPHLSSDNVYTIDLGQPEDSIASWRHDRMDAVSAIRTAVSVVDPNAAATLVDNKLHIQFSHRLRIKRSNFQDMPPVVKGKSCGFWLPGPSINGTITAISATPDQQGITIYEGTNTHATPNSLTFGSLDRDMIPKFSGRGSVRGEKTDVYSAFSLMPRIMPRTDGDGDTSMTNGPKDDGGFSKRPVTGDDDESDPTVRHQRPRIN